MCYQFFFWGSIFRTAELSLTFKETLWELIPIRLIVLVWNWVIELVTLYLFHQFYNLSSYKLMFDVCAVLAVHYCVHRNNSICQSVFCMEKYYFKKLLLYNSINSNYPQTHQVMNFKQAQKNKVMIKQFYSRQSSS